MGKQIRKRTPEEQRVYDQIIDRLVAGESASELSTETGVPANTLRNWKAAKVKRDKKDLATASDALTQFSECKARKTLDKVNGCLGVDETINDVVVRTEEASREILRERNDELGDELKTLLLTQAIVPAVSLASLRGGIEGSLSASDATFRESFQHLRAIMERKGIEDPETGEVVPLTLSQFKLVTAILRDLTKSYADLHLLPHGAIKSAPLRFSDSVPPQHLHLHSHGQRRQPKALEVIDVDYNLDAEPAAKEQLSGEQADLLKEL